MIAGLGQAAELVVQNLDKYMEHMTRCRNALISNLKVCMKTKALTSCGSYDTVPISEFQDQIHDIRINFVVDPRLPNTVSLQVPQNVTAQKVLENCNGKIFASLGAACHSNSQKPSSKHKLNIPVNTNLLCIILHFDHLFICRHFDGVRTFTRRGW